MWVTSHTTLLVQIYNVMNGIMQVEALERVKKRKAEGDQSDEKTLLEEELPKIVLNPNVFTDFKVSGDPEVGVIFSYQIFTRCWYWGTMVPWAFVQLLFSLKMTCSCKMGDLKTWVTMWDIQQWLMGLCYWYGSTHQRRAHCLGPWVFKQTAKVKCCGLWIMFNVGYSSRWRAGQKSRTICCGYCSPKVGCGSQ